MDYSKFLDEDFDVKEWVNDAFKSHKEGSKDQYATTLVMKLQMFIQEVNNVIEESCQQTVQNLPRVVRELEAVKQEASLLQDQMTMVKTDIEKVEQDTAQSMQMLLQVDTIKGRMKAASDALQEADNWTTLSADVDEVFDSGDINAISEKLVGMQQSLQVLVDVPDYAERCQYLETLKNRLEATLSPQLVSAFNSLSLDAAKKYVRIFSDIDRLPQLYKYYHKCQKGELLVSWRNLQEKGSESTLVDSLSEMYDILLSTWHSQIQWCSQVFAEPQPIVTQLLTETLCSLDPPLPACISTYLKTQDNVLPALIHLKQITERFAKSMEGAIESQVSGHLVGASYEAVEKLAAAIYAPYRPYVHKYPELEEKELMEGLNSIKLDHEEILDCVRLLAESVSKLFSIAESASERCVELTNGVGYLGLLQVQKAYFTEYCQQMRRVVTNLREKCRPDPAGLDAEDWSWFQNSLRVIQTCGDLILHVDELDQTMVSSIVSSVGKFCHPSSTPVSPSHSVKHNRQPFHDFDRLLLSSEDERRAIAALITKLEEGDTPTVLEDTKLQMCSLSEAVHCFAFDIVFAPLQSQLANLSNMEIWTSETGGSALTADLPTFSLSPQEYITKVGQYLMTLPQQLEPFTLQDNPTLAVAVKHGKLPYTTSSEETEHLADVWLESVARGTMHVYSEQILKILELTPHATRQLITDIDYLCNVLDDLGLPASESLRNITSLLQSPPSQYNDTAEKMPQRMASAIAGMRGLSLA